MSESLVWAAFSNKTLVSRALHLTMIMVLPRSHAPLHSATSFFSFGGQCREVWYI